MVDYPLKKFRFKLEIDGLGTGGFYEVSSFDTFQPIEYSAGGREAAPHLKMAGRVKYGNIILKYGMIEGRGFYDWIVKGLTGEAERKDVAVSLLDENQAEAASWKVINAWPIKYTVPDFNASSNEIAVEILELAHEGINRVF
ncbi:phage tail protein [Clostridium sp. chh4-2]|uniref:phage tail protein n=1 Tax=Clostridium sp. chh4-2 TaxID=2067550 RepID=UPI000CCF3BF9|nr:phage tail protein [Clostridium sp. chh4-2]PNV62570.1 phage tail protein [Clostridium sp. chh4-2]